MKTATNLLFMLLIFPGALIAHAADEMRQDHDFPPAVTEFHNVMAPLWHAQAGENRAKRICNQSAQLAEHAENILSKQAPKGVNADEWMEIARKLKQDTDKIRSLCADAISPEQALAEVHNTFHALVWLVGHRH